jgi:presenilin-like A22 family membrane protease
MVVGFIAVATAFALVVYASNNQYQLRRLKRNHPGLSVAAVIAAAYLFISLFGSVVVFIFGIALPLTG